MTPRVVPDRERAARLRAARGYSGLSARELADELNVSLETLSRMENARTAVSADRARAYMTACGVPAWFLEHGFDVSPAPENPEHGERLEALEAQMATVLRIIGRRAQPAETYAEDTGVREPAVTGLVPPKARRPPRPGSTPSAPSEQPAQTETDELDPAGSTPPARGSSKPTR